MDQLKRVAVIGEYAGEVLPDWYSGTLPYTVTPLDGIRNKVGKGVTVDYAIDNTNNTAVNVARSSDVAIVVVGNDPVCGNLGWAVPRYASEGREAIVHMSHNSQKMGNALADVLFGDRGASPGPGFFMRDKLPQSIFSKMHKKQLTLFIVLTHLSEYGHTHIAFLNQSREEYEAGYGPAVRSQRWFLEEIETRNLKGITKFCEAGSADGYTEGPQKVSKVSEYEEFCQNQYAYPASFIISPSIQPSPCRSSL